MSNESSDLGSRPVAAYERDPVFYHRVIWWLGMTAVASVVGAVAILLCGGSNAQASALIPVATGAVGAMAGVFK